MTLEKWPDDPRWNWEGEPAECAEEEEWIGATRARSTKRSPDG